MHILWLGSDKKFHKKLFFRNEGVKGYENMNMYTILLFIGFSIVMNKCSQASPFGSLAANWGWRESIFDIAFCCCGWLVLANCFLIASLLILVATNLRELGLQEAEKTRKLKKILKKLYLKAFKDVIFKSVFAYVNKYLWLDFVAMKLSGNFWHFLLMFNAYLIVWKWR